MWSGPPPQQWQQQGDQGGENPPYSNTQKYYPNLMYCYTCGYDVNHDGYNCQRPAKGHIPNVHRNEAHLVPGASMKAQHKVLPDGTGAGKGWLMAQATNKGFYTMAKQGQQPWANIFSQNQNGGRKPKGNKGWYNHQKAGQQWGNQQRNQWGRN